MKKGELKILQALRENSRRSLTDISNLTRVPLSSVFKKVRKFEEDLIKKYTSLVNFNLLGFAIRVNLILKSKNKDQLKKFLVEHPNVNSLYRVSQGFDFFVETVFPSMLEFEDFVEELNAFVVDKQVFHIIEDLRREDFSLKNEQVK